MAIQLLKEARNQVTKSAKDRPALTGDQALNLDSYLAISKTEKMHDLVSLSDAWHIATGEMEGNVHNLSITIPFINGMEIVIYWHNFQAFASSLHPSRSTRGYGRGFGKRGEKKYIRDDISLILADIIENAGKQMAAMLREGITIN